MAKETADPLAAEAPAKGKKKASKLSSDYSKYFDTTRYEDKPDLLKVFQPFSDLADMLAELPDSKQRTLALDHLLIAKDAAVRAALD